MAIDSKSAQSSLGEYAGNGLGSTKGPASTSRHEEYQYLDLVRDIIENGEHRPDRYESNFLLKQNTAQKVRPC